MPKSKTKSTALSKFVAEIDRTTDDRVVVVGPMRWQPREDGGKRWYFIAAYKRRGKFYATSIDTPGYELPITPDDVPAAMFLIKPVTARDQSKRGLVSIKPLVIHDMDDEVAMAQICAVLWPSPRRSYGSRSKPT